MLIEPHIGLVLKKTLYQDNKFLVTLFTQKEGLIHIGVPVGKNQTHRFGSFEAGHLLQLDLIKTKQNFKLHDASVIYSPATIRRDLHRLKQFMGLIHSLTQLLAENVPNPPFFDLIKGAIKAFDLEKDPSSLKNFVLLKWLQIEGLLSLDKSSYFFEELTDLLKIRKFESLDKISVDLQKFIENAIEKELN